LNKLQAKTYFVDADHIQLKIRTPKPQGQREDVKFLFTHAPDEVVKYGCRYGCSDSDSIKTLNQHYVHNTAVECTSFANPIHCCIIGCDFESDNVDEFLKHCEHKNHTNHPINQQLIWVLSVLEMNRRDDNDNGLHLLCYSGFMKHQLTSVIKFKKCYSPFCSWQTPIGKEPTHSHGKDCHFKSKICVLLHFLGHKVMQTNCSEFTSILLPGRRFFPLLNESFYKGRVSTRSVNEMVHEVKEAYKEISFD
jgi:hypothetical protein